MKINYRNEDYRRNIFNIIVYIFSIAVIIYWWLLNGKSTEIGIIVFCSSLILLMCILLYFAIRKYKKERNQRNLNLLIMKNGICIKGIIRKIYDNYFEINNIDNTNKVIHNITAEVEYQQGDNKKIITVDHLVLNINRFKQYNNKTVNVYVYNNMYYIDIVND